MRTRSMLLAGVAGLAVTAFAGAAVAQSTQSWGNNETTYFHSPATSPNFPSMSQPGAPSVAPPAQPGEMLHYRTLDMNDQGSAPGVSVGRAPQPDADFDD